MLAPQQGFPLGLYWCLSLASCSPMLHLSKRQVVRIGFYSSKLRVIREIKLRNFSIKESYSIELRIVFDSEFSSSFLEQERYISSLKLETFNSFSLL